MRLPTFFIPHGGGPWPFMADAFGPSGMWDGLRDYLVHLPESLIERPQAVLVVSGHWQEAQPTVDIDQTPSMLFDYYGFPANTYALKYPAPGAPALASRVRAALAAAGVASGEAEGRGFDHGVFIPFMLMYPQADMPILQLSLQRGADVATHLTIGRALAPLRDEGVLIVGSGMSYHNLGEFFSSSDAARTPAIEFDAWLTRAVESEDAAVRDGRLRLWREAPGAIAAHPTAEHLEPLFVIAGAAGADRGKRSFRTELMGKPISAYAFG